MNTLPDYDALMDLALQIGHDLIDSGDSSLPETASGEITGVIDDLRSAVVSAQTSSVTASPSS